MVGIEIVEAAKLPYVERGELVVAQAQVGHRGRHLRDVESLRDNLVVVGIEILECGHAVEPDARKLVLVEVELLEYRRAGGLKRGEASALDGKLLDFACHGDGLRLYLAVGIDHRRPRVLGLVLDLSAVAPVHCHRVGFAHANGLDTYLLTDGLARLERECRHGGIVGKRADGLCEHHDKH